MHHPGPPRFLAVGEATELAPRDPDPDATYRWSIGNAPAASSVTLSSGPVVWFEPDAPGEYTLVLEAPDGIHELTARVFSRDRAAEGHFMGAERKGKDQDTEAEQPGGVSGGVDADGQRSGPAGRSGQSGPRGRSGVSGYSGGSGFGGVSGPGSGSGGDLAAAARQGVGGGRPRVRLDGGVEDGTVTLTADAVAGGRDATDDGSVAVAFVVDDRDPTPRSFSVDRRTARFDLDDLTEPVRVHAAPYGDRYGVPDSVQVFPDGTVDPLHEPPEWSKDMTLYEVYVRGFKEPSGDDSVFDTIRKNLDYVRDLGVDTLWLTPILQNDDFDHGYNITDFHSVADDLGTEAEFETLVEAAHDRDMRVLFDLVLNHSARDHEFFRAAEDGDPTFRDWYEWEDPETDTPATYFDWPYIANFDFSTLSVRRHLLDAVEKWAGYVDGFRCDMAWAIPTSFWHEVRDLVHEQDAEFLLLDETIPYVPDFHYQAFDIHMDTTLYHYLREVGRGNSGPEVVTRAVEERYTNGFPDRAGFMLYMENHDEQRYVEECGRSATKAAAGAEFTLPGVPLLYAGQEIGEHTRRGEIHWDQTDEELLSFYQRLSRVRNQTPALGYRGDYDPVAVESDADDVVAYARSADRSYVVVLHFEAGTARVRFPDVEVEPRDIVAGESVAADEADAVVDSVAILPVERSR